jgi:hypothetical protein
VSDAVTTAYNAALDAMRRAGPKAMHPLAAMLSDDDSLRDGVPAPTTLCDRTSPTS